MIRKKYIIAVSSFLLAALLIWYLFSLPRNLFDSPVSAVLESRDGALLGARIASDGQWRFPPSDSIPDKFAKAIITYEDKRFRSHFGIDPWAIGSALRVNLRAGEIKRGASTITMQTIRLCRGTRKRNIGTKIIEAILATRLEFRCCKDEILALYASNAPFGGNVVGLEAAAWRYFGRSADELSWGESAMLAILPNSPSLIHPGKNREKLLLKRNALLDKLHKAGILDSVQCVLSKEEQLPERPCPMKDYAPHYLETLRLQGGDRLYRSAIDLNLQRQISSIAEREIEIYRSNKVNNLAAIVLEVETGNVIAYCGNVPNLINSSGGDVDVVQAPRSSGSTLKPFLYGAMLDEGEILPTMLIPDIPFQYKNFSPRNFNNTFDGAVPAKNVIQRSLNIPSVRMLNEYGTEKFYLLLREMGFKTIDRGADTYGLSLILGGAEITLYDLAFVYRAMAAKLSAFGTESALCSDFPLSSGAIWCIFDAISQVNRPEEEGDWKSFSSSRKVGWKTGTSYGNRDAWSVGVTPEYVVGVWVGNCDGEGRPNLTGIGYAAPVMFDIFNALPSTRWFDIPENELQQVVVCSESGYPVSDRCLASIYCRTDTVLTPEAPVHPEVCPFHKILHLSEDEKYIVNSDCYNVSKMKTVSWFVLPPAQEWYYLRSHSDYKRLPPLYPGMVTSEGSISGASSYTLEIIYPQSGMHIAAPVDLDSKTRGVVFSAAHSDPEAALFWHIDDQYIGSTSHNQHKISVIPARGRHTLTIVDNNGLRKSVVFYGQ